MFSYTEAPGQCTFDTIQTAAQRKRVLYIRRKVIRSDNTFALYMAECGVDRCDLQSQVSGL